MTLSTSAVAVCCWSDSRSSLSNRVFSIAMTAWAAKFVHQLNLLVGERTDLLAIDGNCADQLALLEHWHRHEAAGALELRQGNDSAVFSDVGLIGAEVGNVDNLFGFGDAV